MRGLKERAAHNDQSEAGAADDHRPLQEVTRRKRIPLNVVRAIEAVARHISIVRTADELCATFCTVSQPTKGYVRSYKPDENGQAIRLFMAAGPVRDDNGAEALLGGLPAAT